MQRILRICLIAGLAATWVGCQTDSEPAPVAQSATSSDGSSEFTLVTLKVPNMV